MPKSETRLKSPQRRFQGLLKRWLLSQHRARYLPPCLSQRCGPVVPLDEDRRRSRVPGGSRAYPGNVGYRRRAKGHEPTTHVAAVAALVTLQVVRSAAAQEPTWDYPKIPSLTLTDEQFLRGDKEAGVPAGLSAVLQLPGEIPGPLPAVVLLHGSGGYGSGSVDSWVDTFQPLGIATLALDSFHGRGFERTTYDQAQLGLLAMVYDVYRSVEVLAADPRIDLTASRSWASPAAAPRCSARA